MPKKSKLFSSGLYGEKSNGKWGKLTGKEIIEKSLQGDSLNISRLDREQQKQIENEYQKKRKEVSEKMDALQNYLNETGYQSEALDDFTASGKPELEEKPKSFQELLDEYVRAEIFTQSETSTPEGVETRYKDFYEEYEKTDDDDFEEWRKSAVDINKKWSFYRRLERLNPQIISDLGGKSETLNLIEKAIYQGFDMDEFIVNLINQYESQINSQKEDFEQNAHRL